MFVSIEGFTYQPNVENVQVVGIASGENEMTALETLILENEWLKESSFDELIVYELLKESPIMKCSLGNKNK